MGGMGLNCVSEGSLLQCVGWGWKQGGLLGGLCGGWGGAGGGPLSAESLTDRGAPWMFPMFIPGSPVPLLSSNICKNSPEGKCIYFHS